MAYVVYHNMRGLLLWLLRPGQFSSPLIDYACKVCRTHQSGTASQQDKLCFCILVFKLDLEDKHIPKVTKM